MKIGIWEIDKKTIIITLVMFAVLAFAFNQTLGLVYKAQFLSSPCELCVKLNPEWMQCYKQITKPKIVETELTKIKNQTLINITFLPIENVK